MQNNAKLIDKEVILNDELKNENRDSSSISVDGFVIMISILWYSKVDEEKDLFPYDQSHYQTSNSKLSNKIESIQIIYKYFTNYWSWTRRLS